MAAAIDAQADTAILLYNTAIQTAEKCLNQAGSKAYRDAVKRKLIKARLGLGLVFYNRIEYSKAMELYKRALSEAEDMGETALEAETVENPNCPMPTANCQPDISHLPAGIYFVRVSFENKMIVKKIVKL